MREKIEQAISQFNKYHGREARAHLKRIEGNKIAVEFSGPFCFSCGYYDYFEDLLMELEDLGIKGRILEINENDYVEVVFSI